MSQYFVKCGETKVNRRLSSPLAGVSLCIKIPSLQVPNRTKDGVETKKDYLVSKGSRRDKRTPDQEGVQYKTFSLTSKRGGNTKQITVDRGFAGKINISIANKRHKGKMVARERATDRSCCDIDSWLH